MVVALHHIQGVGGQVFARHKPRLVFTSTTQSAGAESFHVCPFGFEAPNAQALALPQGVKTQAHMCANFAAVLVFDRAGLVGDVAVQELAKRAFTNEANARGVFLFRVGQANLIGNAANLGFV